MRPLNPAELRRPDRLLRTRRPWAGLLYLLAETVAGWLTVVAFTSILTIPLWLLLWPRLAPRLLPLAGHRPPDVRRVSPLEVRWRDWALVSLTPVAGVLGTATLGFGVVLPALVARDAVDSVLHGGSTWVPFVSIGSGWSAVAAGLAAVAVIAVVLWLVTVIAYGWGRLVSSLLHDEERRLSEQVDALSVETARAVDQLALERRQLERDLHDGAQLHLGAAGLQLAMLQLDVESLPDSATRRTALESLDKLRTQLDEATEAVRSTARGLVPEALRDGGLCAALAVATRGLPLRSSVRCEVPRLAPDSETGLFFIATEALANVTRHAEAESVEVTVTLLTGTGHGGTGQGVPAVTLEIVDDGCGGARPTGSGLLGIRSRARLLGGRADLHSPVGRGTRLAVTVPYHPCPGGQPSPTAEPCPTEEVSR